jgi:hypothetical protein
MSRLLAAFSLQNDDRFWSHIGNQATSAFAPHRAHAHKLDSAVLRA